MRRVATVGILGALAIGVQGDGAISLTEKNFEEQVFNGKFSFVKFQAPWWGHCKKMKADWDRLGATYNGDDSNAQIFDVDCTHAEGKNVCQKYGVQGYPTIKYFNKDTSDTGDKYEGGRDFAALEEFVKTGSKLPCAVETLENCDEKEKAFIREVAAWEDAKVAAEKAAYQEKIQAAKSKHEEENALFEQQKDVALATMQRAQDAEKEAEKVTKAHKYKINILEQHHKVKSEL